MSRIKYVSSFNLIININCSIISVQKIRKLWLEGRVANLMSLKCVIFQIL